jgi:hypothetical protein
MKPETNFWGSFACAGRSLYFQSTSRTLGGYIRVCPQRVPGARFELLVVSADGHRGVNTQRIDD